MIPRFPCAAGRGGGRIRIAWLVPLWVLAAGCWFSNSVQAADFRGVEWGMSEQTVAQLEPGQPLPILLKGLHYEVMLGTIPARLQYDFKDNKLYVASYTLLRKRATSLEYIREYEVINKSLKGLYGEPLRDEIIWVDRLYEHKPEHWGFALSIGQLKYLAQWETQHSYISHILYGREYKIKHSILYESRAWKDAAGKQNHQSGINNKE